jgi:hypothetical protein
MGHFAPSLGMSQIMLLAVLYRAGFDTFWSQCGSAEARVIGLVGR